MPTEARLKTGLHNTSEIGRLRKVMLHRPGRELENLMPEYLERLLFDDIPYLKAAQAEHDAFAQCLRENGAEVVYLRDLVEETIAEPGIRRELTEQFLDEAGLENHRIRDILQEYFSDMSDGGLVDTMMAGVRKSDVRGFETGKLADYLSFRSDEYPFLIDPMPNLYFTRDPFATIGTGVSLHRMHTVTRNRETLFGKFIFKYHPVYKDTPKWYDRGETSSLEGGDILILSPEVIAVGISQRTQEDSIDKFAHTVLSVSRTFKKILAFNIPKTRSFMHLDTVFTMVDRDKFTVHPNILHEITVFVMELVDGHVHIQEEQGRLEDILKRHLELDDVKLIKCGSDSPIDAAREQWSDGSNTLAIAPGEVVVYERNYVTNRILEDNGITVHTIPCSELSRGRGGPRCMSMPFIRDDL
ncbi:MAG: arginine deiminase [Oscillospiraceae bacterium]|jgi:arginine deiminase|nr:arginine deiminase [Oscillospiraceae bacterium]MDE6996985.1 arginine deiminase [Oscillospiraceae bacterium]